MSLRVTQPKFVDRPGGRTGTIGRRSVPNDVIRELSVLNKKAEILFWELAHDADSLVHETRALQRNVDRLAFKLTQLDVEEVSLQHIHTRKSLKTTDQQVVSPHSILKSIDETYQQCDRPPPLDKLDSYQEDGNDEREFATDHHYIFEQWKQDMFKDAESSTPINILSENSTPVSECNKNGQVRESVPPPSDKLVNGRTRIPLHVLQRTRSLISRSSTPLPTHNNGQLQSTQRQRDKINEKRTPDSPDLPPPTRDKAFMKAPPGCVAAPPPPPPPPPPALGTDLMTIVNGDACGRMNAETGASQGSEEEMASSSKSGQRKAAVETSGRNRSGRSTNALLPPAHGTGSDWLAAIREGIKLRKVEPDIKQNNVEKRTAPLDVASILARRVVLETSDSDTASESEYDSEAWDA